MNPALWLFWGCAAVPLLVYGVYPLAMMLLARRRPDPAAVPPPAEWPSVTLIIAAFNEEAVLGKKLRNALALDYPRDQLDIWVASDGSTDRTDAIAESFASRGVRLLRLEGRQGKTAVQNAAAARAAGEILVFSDANAFYRADALRKLIPPFQSPDVGVAEGRRADHAPTPAAETGHELAYRDLESRLKGWESRVFSCTGATGPLYAVRRALYVPLDPALISDLLEPLLVVSRFGKRHIFVPDALSSEAVLPGLGVEFRRKVRIMTRCLNSLRRTPEVFDPRRRPGFVLQVLLHRLLRWLAPAFLLGAAGANLFLLEHPFHQGLLLLQLAFGAAALAGFLAGRRGRAPAALRLPCYVLAANAAALAALLNCLRGRHVVAWGPRRP